MYYTVNYLQATYLQTISGGLHAIVKVDKIKPGKAKFYFDITEEEAGRIKLEFHDSECLKFEQIRRNTIDLAY